jgi:AhpD family alkylhydroperoxidase
MTGERVPMPRGGLGAPHCGSNLIEGDADDRFWHMRARGSSRRDLRARRMSRRIRATRVVSGVPSRTLDLIYLCASQINGCSVCVDMHARDLKKAGETQERLFAVAA